MVNLKFLSDWPSPKKTKILLILAIAVLIIIYPLMMVFFNQSGDTINIMVSQLSFSGPFLKAQYAIIIAANGLNSYTIAQSLDYGFMVGYGLLAFSLHLMIARKYGIGSKWQTIGFVAAISGIVAACMDASENAFILATLSDPLAFPDWWAVAHSSFALVKYIFLLFAITWVFITGIYYLLKKKS